MVGAHWFIYGDFDNPQREANRGLVRSDGQLWEYFVRELAAVHAKIDVHIGHSRAPAK